MYIEMTAGIVSIIHASSMLWTTFGWCSLIRKGTRVTYRNI